MRAKPDTNFDFLRGFLWCAVGDVVGVLQSAWRDEADRTV
jgi:hypothetical protein